MKKKILLLMGIFSIGFILHAQIAINTENPLALFHIDGKGDNSPVPTNTEISNDVVVTSDGRLGIGTLTPSTNLEIVSDGTVPALRIETGQEANNKVFATDDFGIANWQPTASTVVRQLPKAAGSYTGTETVMDGSEFTVPEDGNYLIYYSFYGTTTNFNPAYNIAELFMYLYKSVPLTLLDSYYYSVTVWPSSVGALRPSDVIPTSISTYLMAENLKVGDKIYMSAKAGFGIWNYNAGVSYSTPNFVFIKISN